jgi:hypothetical protein
MSGRAIFASLAVVDAEQDFMSRYNMRDVDTSGEYDAGALMA